MLLAFKKLQPNPQTTTQTTQIFWNVFRNIFNSIFRNVFNEISINSIITLIRLQTLLLDLKRVYYILKILQRIQSNETSFKG
ncbi:hypothetical protein HPSA20_0851 [Helicobacter pylori SouthAfrica20]|uniref:Uncharacterized protein n=1 Tax=Helicobacter pylori SouthAfrica20 TaxID=1352356 RepID=T1UAY7_HELPX|nr:hypothetical protein HPSA20_0851 [Helicobacter pylori SouthAfrica20]